MTTTDAPETKGLTIRWWARFYDIATFALTFGQEPAIRRKTIEVAAPSPGESVLDIGCGTGTLSIAAWREVQSGGRVFGIDASPEMIELARRKATTKGVVAEFQVAPVEALPFPDAHFDLVLSSFMLHHLPDDVKQQGFAEILRVLKPGGRFLAVDLGDRNRSLMARLPALFGHAMPRGYVDGLKAMMAQAGLEDIQELDTGFGYLAFLRAQKPES
jgi:demethylmenaquinone methyltransferase/2-methoxy-6-polyprenyl-1,4-benzoquinol methylase/phosphoethanolamine N-methyltransferase